MRWIPVAGDAMLERMMRYLEVALPSMRGERVTLGREATLIEAYLDLQKVRMGRRLAFRIDIAPALRQVEVPPMMLLTLVENAIKHGLAPERDGGRIDIGARVHDEVLELEVADTGRGFGGDTSGGGTGLANIRIRLAAMFGDAASVDAVGARAARPAGDDPHARRGGGMSAAPLRSATAPGTFGDPPAPLSVHAAGTRDRWRQDCSSWRCS